MTNKRFSFTPNERYPNSSEMVSEAIELAENILDNPEFYNAIEKKKSFDYTDVSPADIANYIREHDTPAKVSVKKLGPFAYATTTGDVFTINVRKLISWRGRVKRGIPSIVGTLVHEYVHVVDNAIEEDFGHGSNSPAGKENSAPYWIGEQAVVFANEIQSIEKELRQGNITASILASASADRQQA